jgi:lipooligosaccharide transport system permease protein
MAFSAPIAAFSASQDNDAGFTALYRFGLIPLFLFSGTFFPITQLPGWLQAVAEVTPLYHGVALCRDLTLGQLSAGSDILHTVYLVTLTTIGYLLARRTFRKRLIT